MTIRKIKAMAFPTGMLILSIPFWLELNEQKANFNGGDDYGFNPNFFPEIMLYLWSAICLLLLLQSVIKSDLQSEDINLTNLALSLSMVSAYIFSMYFIGFLISSILFMMIFIYTFGYRKKTTNLLTSLIFPLSVWYIFTFPLNINLPLSSLSLGSM